MLDSSPVTGIAPVLGGGEAPPPAPSKEEIKSAAERVIALVLRALGAIGKPVDLDTIAAEINAGLPPTDYIAGGVLSAVVTECVRAGKLAESQSKDSPPRTLYALAEPAAPTFIDKAPGIPLEARAAVAAVLGGGRVYVALPDGTPDPTAEPETPVGGFDANQVAFAVCFAQQEPVKAQIAVPSAFVSAFVDGLDVAQPEPMIARAALVLDAFAATEPALVVRREEGDPVRVAYLLSRDGQVLFAERGAVALADATMAPKPSAEERFAELERSHLEAQKRLVADHGKAIEQRDKALKALGEKEKSLGLYRDWFASKNLSDPDAIVAARPTQERKVIRGYTIERALTVEEHFRLVRELDDADRSFAVLLEQQGEATAAMKSAKQKAEGKVSELKGLVKLPADGRKNVIVKDVYKVVEDGQIAVYSADLHDDGALICYEPIPSGTQRVIAATGVREEAPPEPTRRGKKKAEAPVEEAKPDAAPAPPAEPSATPAPVDAPDFSGIIRTLLVQKGPLTAEEIAKKLEVSVADVIRSIGLSAGHIQQSGDRYEVPQPPKKGREKADEVPAPKSPKKTSLDPETIERNILDLLATEPHARTGIKRTAFPAAYCEYVGLKLTDSLARLLDARLDVMLKRGSVAKGEGGDDMLVWRADLDDPRKTGSDREAKPAEKAEKPKRGGRKAAEGKAGASA